MSSMRITPFLLAVLFPLALSGADSAGPFSFADPTVRILAGAQDGTGDITLRSSVEQTTPPTVSDFDLPHPPAANVTFEFVKDSIPQTNPWHYRVRVSGLAPSSTTQQHYAQVSYGDHKIQIIPYFVTNQAAGNFSWSISKLPEPWVASEWLPTTHCTSFSVTPKDFPAMDVTLGSSTLVEQSTKEAIPIGKLRLCAGEKCPSTEAINLPANVPSKLQICTIAAFQGNFHGVVTIASRQKPDGDTILQSAQFSSFLVKAIGVIFILAGVFLAWWSKVWARARLERDQALMPALLMRSRLKALKEILGQLRQPYRGAPVHLNNSIQNLLNELTDSVLDNNQFLPPVFPSPYGYTVDAAGYKAYLEARNSKIQLFSVLVKQGVVDAEAEDNGALTAAQQALVATAIEDIDRICTNVPVPSADQAIPLIQPILTTLRKALFPPPATARPAVASLPLVREFEVLQLEMQSISKGIWLLYGILTALSGLAVLVLNNPAFGVPLDFVFAFFWGFGLPISIGAIAPSSSATALNISIAKG